MKYHIKTFFLALLINGSMVAQTNLVPNPSFEDTLNCNLNYGLAKVAFPWFSPTNCTPDYYTSFSNCGFSSTNNPSGFQLPRTGTSYLGMYFWNGNTREYISIKLDSILISGKKYRLSFYVSRANGFQHATNRLGALISPDTSGFYSGVCNQLIFLPQVQNQFSNIITDSLNWTLISGNFIAGGGEKFLTIGNFFDSINTNVIVADSSAFANGAYYYVEDVNLFRCDTCFVGVPEINHDQEIITLFPNPASDFSEILMQRSEINIIGVDLFTLSGQKLEKLRIEQQANPQKVEIHFNDLSNGFYLLRIHTSWGLHSYKLVIIHP